LPEKRSYDWNSEGVSVMALNKLIGKFPEKVLVTFNSDGNPIGIHTEWEKAPYPGGGAIVTYIRADLTMELFRTSQLEAIKRALEFAVNAIENEGQNPLDIDPVDLLKGWGL
jgi:hypothetical protein